jgi:hypothetical protein
LIGRGNSVERQETRRFCGPGSTSGLFSSQDGGPEAGAGASGTGGNSGGASGDGGCIARTCEAQGLDCGKIDDGCGAILDGVVCPPGETCGATGRPNVCGVGECLPRSCVDLAKNCGQLSDGCSNLLQCGDPGSPRRVHVDMTRVTEIEKRLDALARRVEELEARS